jgi:phage/plasmid primase-like uncharacterized protein
MMTINLHGASSAANAVDAVGQFRNAMRARGIIPPTDIVGDGKIHRADVTGKNGKDDASYLLYLNGLPAGGFENHKDGLGWEPWKADTGRRLSSDEQEQQRTRIELARRERETEQAGLRNLAWLRARVIWKAASPAPPDHPYLVKKSVKPHGIRQYRGGLIIGGMVCDEALLIPLRDGAGSLQSLQFIAPDGEKRFLPNGLKRGCYFIIGEPGERICIAEGYATGASIHEATAHAVVVAFDAGNLEPAARAIRAQYAAAKLILCADDDYRTAGNPGIARATEAALAVGGLVAVPEFGNDRPADETDFNDLYRLWGHEAVERSMAAAKVPDVSTRQQPAHNATTAVLEGDDWPEPLAPEAMHGLAGEIAQAIGPDTEADPAAILLQTLVAFGALVARGPHVRVEGDEHHTNLFMLLVGETSKGRKGTSWGRVRQLFGRIESWKPTVSGLSSGEGLKFNVRDQVQGLVKNKSGEKGLETTDIGVSDKRLLVIEPEFAQALRVAARPGNTLSATVREAWDTGRLATLTKNDPITATGAHVCIVGHITADELRAELTATDTASGFANRFLFVGARRSKVLPFGGANMPDDIATAFAQQLEHAAGVAQTCGALAMTPAARKIWATVYPALSEGRTGLRGAATARAEAQCIRLSLIYALLDEATAIDAPHLFAALAVWEYCDATARYIFGATLGDRIADEIMRALKVAGSAGRSRTEIRDLFKRHQTAERLGQALELLTRRKLVRVEQRQTGGRPEEIWTMEGAT